MKVINIHRRKINQPEAVISELFATLATQNDAIWPNEDWPAMHFKDGLKKGSKGGHGRIRYSIIDYVEGKQITFQFSKPEGFLGTHELKIIGISESKTEIKHEINMNTKTLKATFFWSTAIRWLHDALIEDAFDKLENHFSQENKKTKHSIWVTLLRDVYKRKSFQTKHI